MIRALFGLVLVLAFCLVPGVAFAVTPDQALAACNAEASTKPYSPYFSPYSCELWTSAQNGAGGSPDSYGYKVVNKNGERAGGWYAFDGLPPPNCPAGQVVAPGTPYLVSSASGTACTSGTDKCEMAFNVGGPNSGGYSLTGAACPAATDGWGSGSTPDPSDSPPPGKPPPETSNPDGSKTFCDQISGTCVTAAPGAGAPPPSTGDTGDNADNSSTSGSSTTTNGATSSTTTTTTSSTTNTTTNTTTTGGGTSGGSGDSTSVGTTTGTTTGTETSTTDTPASSSSTSSQCTTGVCDVGRADGIMGGMYEPSGETPGTVYAQFRASVSASPLVSSVSGFFDTSGITGSSCPTWHIPGNVYWGQDGFSFDFFCSAGMLALLALAGMLVLAVGAFSAFRIAIY